MYKTSLQFHNRINRGEKPLVYCLIATALGVRAYAEKEIREVFDIAALLADGTIIAGGDELAGWGTGLIDKAGRVLSFGQFERTIQPQTADVLGSIYQKQLQHISVALQNEDNYFSKILPKEPFLGCTLSIYVGFEEDPFADHIKLFEGVISQVGIGQQLIIDANEKEVLSAYYYLPRAGRYSAPLNSNDRLPDVYGDLTDGTSGNWVLPCIDTANYVYCYAAHEVLSIAEGNSVNIYADGVLVDPADYTFDESNNYESEGAIATITFTADQANKTITARGAGKDSSAVLVENIIDIINDFLVTSNGYSSSIFESTAKAIARAKFEGQSYKAAGVITDDCRVWDKIQEMIGSFFGCAYINGPGLLVLEIDDGTVLSGKADVIPKSDLSLDSAAIQRIENLINACPASYGYDYVNWEFRHHTNDTTYHDLVSQGIFGIQEPANPFQCYWCRELTSIQKLQGIITAKFSFPIWEVSAKDSSLKRCHIDVGDIISATMECLYDEAGNEFINRFFKVIGVLPDFSRGNVGFRLLDTGITDTDTTDY